MADPIGVVGTAVGVVSFGLQLYSAAATYIDALDGRRDDLASTRAKLDSLRDSLTTIQSALPSSPSSSPGTSTIPPIVTECKAELDQLEVLLQDLVGSNTSGNKLKERIKTLKFPFRRDSLIKLEDRLHKTNGVFQTALSVLNLNKSLDNERRFTNVETTTAQIPAINTNVVQISTDVQDLRVDVGNMSTNIDSAISRMNSNNNEVLSRLDLSMTQITATAGQSLPQISNSIALIEQRMQSLSALEERLRSLSLLEQILGIQDAPVQATPQLALQRLLAKPSQSREIYDSLSHSMSMTTHHGSGSSDAHDWSISTEVRSRSCSCMYRNNRRRTSRSFAPLWLRTETTHLEHDHDCELSNLRLGKLRRRFGLTATRPFSILPWSLEISFALTTGAGGFSISPNITLRPIIDGEKSPVFRILYTLHYYLTHGSYTHAELSCSLSATKTTILRLYSQKKAFVNEIAEGKWFRGTAIFKMTLSLKSTPLHSLAVGPDSRNEETNVGALSDMIVELVQAGLPVDGCDSGGRTAVTEVALSGYLFFTKGLLPVLHKATPDPVRELNETFGFLRINTYEPSSKSVLNRIRADVFDCGPLSTAIIAQKDVKQINGLINANSIFEVNSFGQTPVHLAAGTGMAEVLSALLRVKGTHDIVHARDTNGYDAITYAAFYSGVSCYNKRKPEFCSTCCCTSTLDVLLCADGFFDDYLHDQRGFTYFSEHLRSASHSWKLRFLAEIKLRRDELRQLASSYLDVGDIHRYKLDGDGVLDQHGAEVIECLTEMGIEVPARFQNSFLDPVQDTSIYYLLPCVTKHEAQLLFDLGFREIDEPDDLGFTPLTTLFQSYNGGVALMLWFVEHGADLARPIPDIGPNNGHSRLTTAHLMARNLAGSAADNGLFRPFMSKIAPVSTVDGCKCHCTEIGCTPASILFFYFTGALSEQYVYVGGAPFRYWHRQQKATIFVVSYLAELFEDNEIDMTIHRHACLVALRMLTFEALGIRHTCGCRKCDNESTSDDSLSAEDVEDIWEEDAHLIDRLNELQIEFETSFDESGMSFNAFLVELWVPRMETVFQELDQVELSEAERGDAELLGVRWDSCEVQHGPWQDTDTDTEEDDYVFRCPETLQGYLRAIRKIAEE